MLRVQPSATRIFIGNIGEIDERSLHEYCLEWGEIRKCRVMREADTGWSRGFAFVNFKSGASARNFLAASPHFLGDRKLVVKSAAVSDADTTSLNKFSNDLFVAYHRSLHSRSSPAGDCESLLSQHFSNFPGIVDVTFGGSQHHQDELPSNSGGGHLKSIGYAVVSFGDSVDLERCLELGRERQIGGGIKLSVRRVVSTESELKRKRKMMEEARLQAAIAEQKCEESTDNEPVVFFRMPSLLGSNAPKQKQKFPTGAGNTQTPPHDSIASADTKKLQEPLRLRTGSEQVKQDHWKDTAINSLTTKATLSRIIDADSTTPLHSPESTCLPAHGVPRPSSTNKDC